MEQQAFPKSPVFNDDPLREYQWGSGENSDKYIDGSNMSFWFKIYLDTLELCVGLSDGYIPE